MGDNQSILQTYNNGQNFGHQQSSSEQAPSNPSPIQDGQQQPGVLKYSAEVWRILDVLRQTEVPSVSSVGISHILGGENRPAEVPWNCASGVAQILGVPECNPQTYSAQGVSINPGPDADRMCIEKRWGVELPPDYVPSPYLIKLSTELEKLYFCLPPKLVVEAPLTKNPHSANYKTHRMTPQTTKNPTYSSRMTSATSHEFPPPYHARIGKIIAPSANTTTGRDPYRQVSSSSHSLAHEYRPQVEKRQRAWEIRTSNVGVKREEARQQFRRNPSAANKKAVTGCSERYRGQYRRADAVRQPHAQTAIASQGQPESYDGPLAMEYGISARDQLGPAYSIGNKPSSADDPYWKTPRHCRPH